MARSEATPGGAVGRAVRRLTRAEVRVPLLQAAKAAVATVAAWLLASELLGLAQPSSPRGRRC